MPDFPSKKGLTDFQIVLIKYILKYLILKNGNHEFETF